MGRRVGIGGIILSTGSIRPWCWPLLQPTHPSTHPLATLQPSIPSGRPPQHAPERLRLPLHPRDVRLVYLCKHTLGWGFGSERLGGGSVTADGAHGAPIGRMYIYTIEHGTSIVYTYIGPQTKPPRGARPHSSHPQTPHLEAVGEGGVGGHAPEHAAELVALKLGRGLRQFVLCVVSR